jgi:hypothetical protein
MRMKRTKINNKYYDLSNYSEEDTLKAKARLESIKKSNLNNRKKKRELKKLFNDILNNQI